MFKLYYKAAYENGFPSKWEQFDPGASYTYLDAIARIDVCSFSGNHVVKIVRDDVVIFEEVATTAQAVEFMQNHGMNPSMNPLLRANDRNNNPT